jgi:hypothetical protein
MINDLPQSCSQVPSPTQSNPILPYSPSSPHSPPNSPTPNHSLCSFYYYSCCLLVSLTSQTHFPIPNLNPSHLFTPNSSHPPSSIPIPTIQLIIAIGATITIVAGLRNPSSSFHPSSSSSLVSTLLCQHQDYHPRIVLYPR